MGIIAEIHGKVSSSGSNINDRLEDILTSNVFQLLRYLPIELGILPVLISAENSHDEKQRRTFVIPTGVNIVSYYFWSRFNNWEPDVFIELKHDEKVLANIMIEAKYLSGKSGSAVYEEDEDGNKVYVAQSDQLEKLWNSLKAYSNHVPYYLFYLTMDWVMPIQSINESIKAISDYDCRGNIYWLNWQSIHTTLNNIIVNNRTIISKADAIVIKDIINLLAKKGLKEFAGIGIHMEHKDYDLVPFNYYSLKYYDLFPSGQEFNSLKYFNGGQNG